MHDSGDDDEEDFDTPTKTEPGSRKRKITAVKPKIEDCYGEDDDEGNGDAIDFSLAYPADVKVDMMEGAEGAEIVDLTDEVGEKAKGKGKEKVMEIEKAKVKKEVVDAEVMDEDETGEMVV